MEQQVFEFILKEVNELKFTNDTQNEDVLLSNYILELLYDQGRINIYNNFYYHNEGKNAKCFAFTSFNNKIVFYSSIFSNSLELNIDKVDESILQLENFYNEIRNSLYKRINISAEYYDDIYQISEILNRIGENNIEVEYQIITNAKSNLEYPNIIDISMIQELLLQTDNNVVDIDILKYSLDKSIIPIKAENDKTTIFLLMLPGYFLAKLYEEYHNSILDKNIRYYLDEKGKVNKGIMETLKKEPDFFTAFNNGLSCVCKGVELDEEGAITKILDFQIVNGGQTTASLHSAMEKGYALSGVQIQVKLTLIKDIKDYKILPEIAKYANTQNNIQIADHHSNEKYLKEIELISRNIPIPSNIKGVGSSRWFFERARGQLMLEKLDNLKVDYDSLYPKKMRFTKLDLGKYIMSWEQYPYDVTKGQQRNFSQFMRVLKSNPDNESVDEMVYKNIISLKILFTEIDALCLEEKVGFKSNVVAYTLSKFSFDSNKKINLEKIWLEQGINNSLRLYLRGLVAFVFESINESLLTISDPNFQTWSKKKQCWDELKSKQFPMQIPSEYSSGSQKNLLVLLDGDLLKEKPEFWYELSKWGKKTDKISSFERSMAYTMGDLAKREKRPTAKQYAQAELIYNKLESIGFLDYYKTI